VWTNPGDRRGVLAVYSLSERRPLKIANFDIRFQNMENREKISDWKFLMAGGGGVNPAVVTPPNSMVGQPSLFAPGTAGALPGAGGKAGTATPGGAKGEEAVPVPAAPAQPAPPPAPAPPKDESDEEMAEEEKAQEAEPVRTDEEKEKEGESGREPDATAKPPEPSQYVPIVPPPVVRKRQ
jgi:hypothetical protein